MSYATIAQLREYLGQVPAGSGYDAQLQSALDRASGIVSAALRPIVFAAWPVTSTIRYQWASGYSSYLAIPYHQPGSVSVVTQNNVALSSSYYREEPDSYHLEYIGAGRVWPQGDYAITAIYGYGPVPDEIVELELELACNIWRTKGTGLNQEFTGATGYGGIKYVGGLNTQQRMIVRYVLQRYKPREIA